MSSRYSSVVHVRFSSSERELLEKISSSLGCSVSSLIRSSVTSMLVRYSSSKEPEKKF